MKNHLHAGLQSAWRQWYVLGNGIPLATELQLSLEPHLRVCPTPFQFVQSQCSELFVDLEYRAREGGRMIVSATPRSFWVRLPQRVKTGQRLLLRFSEHAGHCGATLEVQGNDLELVYPYAGYSVEEFLLRFAQWLQNAPLWVNSFRCRGSLAN